MSSATEYDRLLSKHPPQVQAAIEKVTDRAGTSDADWNVLVAAGEIIAELEAAQRWIPVSERLPEKYVQVRVRARGFKDREDHAEIVVDDAGNRVWRNWNWHRDLSIDEVESWQPITGPAPASAKEGGDAGEEFQIFINTQSRKVQGPSISFEQVLSLAGVNSTDMNSGAYEVEWLHGSRSGRLTSGASVALESGMRFDAGRCGLA